MGILVTTGTTLQCSFGVAPSSLNVLPTACVMSGAPAATHFAKVDFWSSLRWRSPTNFP